MIFDTDILIWVQRANTKAAALIDKTKERFISAQTYMELLQDMQSKKEQALLLNFLYDFQFAVLPFTENISHRASIYIEEYALAHGMRAGDAIIAATAMEHNKVLATGNSKHFRCIPHLKLHLFKA